MDSVRLCSVWTSCLYNWCLSSVSLCPSVVVASDASLFLSLFPPSALSLICPLKWRWRDEGIFIERLSQFD